MSDIADAADVFLPSPIGTRAHLTRSRGAGGEGRCTTRRNFLINSGLLLGFVFAPGGLLRVVDAHACGELGDVDLNAWVHVSNSENTITVKCPTAEMGQGVYTLIPLLIAEELDADWRTIRVEQAPSEKAFVNPEYFNLQGVGGRRATPGYWRIAQLAGAQARAILIANAAREWKVDVVECITEPNNVVHAASGRKLSYMEIARFDEIQLDAPLLTEKNLKSPAQWRLLGKDVPRLDVFQIAAVVVRDVDRVVRQVELAVDAEIEHERGAGELFLGQLLVGPF